MMRRYMLPAIPMAALLMLAGCTDDNYDLSNIDTTSKIPVSNLTVPMNLQPVTLNSIIEIDESENFSKELYTGDDPSLQGKEIFVFHYSGKFNSDPIHINTFEVKAPEDMESSEVEVVMTGATAARPATRAIRQLPGADAVHYDIKDTKSDFTYNISDVDDKVKSVRRIQTPSVTFETVLTIPTNVMNDAREIEITNVRVEYPKGIWLKNGNPATALVDGQKGFATYDPASGIITISDYTLKSNKINLTLFGEEIDMEVAGVTLANGHFTYDGYIEVLGGDMYYTPRAGVVPVQRFMMATDYDLSSFDVENFTGYVDYDIEGLEFEPVDLNDVPDFLAQEGTDIILANPQLYISFINTCAQYGLSGETTLEVKPIRNGAVSATYEMENPINVGDNLGSGPYKFAISPMGTALTPISDYSNATKLMFADFGKVLSGDGLPQQVDVEFATPVVLGEAQKFPLRMKNDASVGTIDPVNGTYEFRAPLALEKNSVIGYSDTKDDWDSDELKDLHVKYLTINTTVSSTIPLAVTLQAYPIDEYGKRLGYCSPIDIPALCENIPVSLEIKCIKDIETADESDYLSGIHGIDYIIKAVATEEYANPDDVPPLSPEMTLTLSNLKATVDGFYLYVDEDYDKD